MRWVKNRLGFGHFSESSTLVFGGPNPGKTGTTTGVEQAGLGLDVKIYKHFTLRGEGREFWSGVPQLNVNTGKSHQYNLFAGGASSGTSERKLAPCLKFLQPVLQTPGGSYLDFNRGKLYGISEPPPRRRGPSLPDQNAGPHCA